MVNHCIVKNCSNIWYPGCEIFFHRFPKDSKRRDKWLNRLKIKGSFYESATVCSVHFSQENYYRNRPGRLLTTALPSFQTKSDTQSSSILDGNAIGSNIVNEEEEEGSTEINQNMSSNTDINVCRICLNFDVKIYDMKESNMNKIYKNLTNLNVETIGIPNKVCTDCLMCLKKIREFKKKCLTANEILTNILSTQDKLTRSSLKSIDRVKHKLASKLSYLLKNNSNIFNIRYDDQRNVRTFIPYNNIYISHVSITDDSKKCIDSDEIKDIDAISNTDYNETEVSNDKSMIILLNDRFHDEVKMDSDDYNTLETPDEFRNEDVIHDYVKADSLNTENGYKLELDVVKTEPYLTTNRTNRSQIKRLEKANKHKNSDTTGESVKKLTLKGVKSSDTTGKSVNELTRKEIEMKRKVDKRFKHPKDIEHVFVIEKFLTLDEQRAEFEKRRTSENYVESRFKCDLCLKGFREKALLDMHMNKHEIYTGKFLCAICQYRLPTSKTLSRHVNSNHTAKYTCNKCEFYTFNKAQARNHHAWHQGVEHKCPHCDKSFRKYSTFMGHIRLVHPSQFICGSCANSFVSEQGLNHHRKVVHKDEGRDSGSAEQMSCKECKVTFVNYKIYVKHLLTSPKHSTEAQNILGCRECGEQFEDAEAKSRHKHIRYYMMNADNVKKKQTKKQMIQCSQCNEQFRHPISVYHHFVKCHPNIPYKVVKPRSSKVCLCELCGKTYMCQAQLTAHKRLHTGERPYKCDQCTKGFRTRLHLKCHKNSHKGLKLYDCKECGKSFSSTGNLFKHTRIHTGVKPFKCEICHKAFVDSSNLKQHIQGVHYNVRRARNR